MFIIGYKLLFYYSDNRASIFPFSETQILKYLEDNYKQKFALKYEVTLNNDDKNKLYVAYPLENTALEFYVYDEYDKGYLSLGSYKGPSRKLRDNYTHVLVSNDLDNIRKIYNNISLKQFSNDDGDYSYLAVEDMEVELLIDYDLNASNVNELNNIFMDVVGYLNSNIAKYKNVHTSITLRSNDVFRVIGTGTVDLDTLKNDFYRKLVYNYREDGNSDIFNIPSNIKANYKVENIGYGNDITRILVNNREVYIVKNNTIKLVYYNGCLKADISDIFDIVSDLRNHLNVVNYSDFKGLDKIKEDILFAYEKDGNIYIVSKASNDTAKYLYQYIDNDVSPISWQKVYTFNCNDELKQIYEYYFGIRVSYDFDREILHFDYIR
jgi:hypothetical protein